MRNILSYQHGCLCSGKEIIEWAEYHSRNRTFHARRGAYILKHYKLCQDRMYRIYRDSSGTGCCEYKPIPFIVRA